MKNLITTIGLALFCTASIAQYKHWNEEKRQYEQYNSYEEYVIEKSNFIFEGEVVENIFFQYDDSTAYSKPYTSSTMQINKIMKGGDKIQLGTITLISKGGMTKEGMYLDKSWYAAGYKGLFFCATSDYPTSGEITWVYSVKNGYSQSVPSATTTPNVDNSVIITMLSPIDFGEDKVFKTKYELYDYLQKQGHITIEKEDTKEQFIKKKDASSSSDAEKAENKLRYEQRVRNYNTYTEHMEQRMKMMQ